MGDERQDNNLHSEEVPDVPDADSGTVELIFEHTKDGPGDQLRDSEQLDTKATAVFAAATVAVGLAARVPNAEVPIVGSFVGTLTDNQWIVNLSVVDLCVYLTAIFWMLSAGATVLNLRTRSYYRPLQADGLWPDYAKREPDSLKRILVRDAARAYKYNRDVLKRKASLLNTAVLAIGLEGLFLVIALVLTR